MRFGKGVKTRLVLEAIQRRAEHYAELEAMTPEQRAEHDAGIEAIKAMLPKPAQPDIEMLASALTNAPLAPSDSQGRQRAPVVPNSENGLMPCPFCGGKAHQLTIEQDDDPHFGGDVITCTECWASSHVEFGFKENLKSAWNSRTAMLQAGNSPVIQDGWQLVPKEPTEAMNKAGWAAMNEHDAINPTYRAMLAAAPQQDVRLALEIGMSRYAGAMQKLVDSGD
ncbi:TPA: Lar family restriction alleviation protein [Citrobacter freundii]